MQPNTMPIGVMDSGVGGLSVVLALQKVLPNEDIVYFGDTANCPYGNKSREELLLLSGNMLSFLQKKGIKCLALACNTTSSLADPLRQQFNIPIITVAECAAEAVGKMSLPSVGLIATVATVNGGIYKRGIQRLSPDTKVFSIGSALLAGLVEKHEENTDAVACEIKDCMDSLLSQSTVETVILGCTHYPIVKDVFSRLYPDITFLDPAPYQANCVENFLKEQQLQNNAHQPSLTIYTTGSTDVFHQVCEQIGLDKHYKVQVHNV